MKIDLAGFCGPFLNLPTFPDVVLKRLKIVCKIENVKIEDCEVCNYFCVI